jgi:ornithine carbamoyltransferase
MLVRNKIAKNLRGRDLLTLKDYSKEELEYLIKLGLKIKNNPQKFRNKLDQKTMVMLFEKTSTRTRTSFEAGMTQLGGHAIYLDWKSSQLSIGAELRDEARSLERYCDVIGARVFKQSTLEEMSKYIRIPVINLLSDKFHPCQALGDIMTIKEKFGKLEGLKMVYTGIGNNVSNSLVVAATKLGMKITLAIPERDPDSIDDELEKQAKITNLYKKTKKLRSNLEDVDILYTDTWVDMEMINDPRFKEERERRYKTFKPFQVSAKLIEETGTKAKIMHCLAAHVGYEITRDAIDHPRSIIFDQAENRLHIQKAILVSLVN